MFTYILLTVLLIILIFGYLKLADHYNIIDKPNNRSSHSTITIRGGGIIFPIAALLWFLVYGFTSPLAMAGLGIMAVVSFLDDLKPLSSKIRILAHITAVTLLFGQIQLFGFPWFIVLVAYFFTIAWINAFNFMDGINAITPFYSIVTLSTFFWLNKQYNFASEQLIIILIISVAIFSWFNARRQAKIFAGDVGSVTMAFLLAWLMIMLIIKTGHLEYILLFAVYGIDSSMTIIMRILRRENIFQAHRSHLYQYLANELGFSHVLVSSIYSIVQLFVNLLLVWLIQNGQTSILVSFLFLFILTMLYLVIRLFVGKKLKLQ